MLRISTIKNYKPEIFHSFRKTILNNGVSEDDAVEEMFIVKLPC